MAVSNPQIAAQLQRIYPFRALPVNELETLIGKMKQKTMQKEDLLYDIGQEAHQFLIVSTGIIRLERLNSNNQYETFSNIDHGEFAGLEAIYPENPYETRAICQNSGVVLILEQADLLALFKTSVEFDMYLHMLGTSYYPLLSMSMSWRQEEESVFWSSRKHPIFLWMRCAIPLMIGILLLTVYLLLLINDVTGVVPLSIIFGGMLLVVIFPAIYFYFDWADDFFIITDRRVISRNRVMLLYEIKQETHIDAILSVNKKIKNVFAATVDFGDIIIRTYTGTLLFEKIPKPNMVAELLDDVRARQQVSQSKTNRQEKVEEMRARLGYTNEPSNSTPQNSQLPGPSSEDFSETGFFSVLNSVFQALFQLRTVQGDQVTFRTHWFMLLKQTRFSLALGIIPLIYFAAFLINLAMGGSFSPPIIFHFVMSILFLITFALTTYEYIDWRNDRYIVNSRQIIDLDQKPFGREDRRAASLSAIQSVEFKRVGFFGIVLNFGTVYIRVGDIQFTFDNVPNPSSVQQEIAERLQAAKEKEKQDEIMREQNAVLEWIEIYHSVTHNKNGETPPEVPPRDEIGQAQS